MLRDSDVADALNIYIWKHGLKLSRVHTVILRRDFFIRGIWAPLKSNESIGQFKIEGG
jgi:hypothetical protein